MVAPKFHVTPGGAPVSVPLTPDLTLSKFSVGRMDNNVYLFSGSQGSVLIDAAAAADRILQVIEATAAGPIQAIVTTHRHHDHVGALEALTSAFPTAVRYAGAPDAAAIQTATGVSGIVEVWDGDVVSLDGSSECELSIIGLVGHTPGSITVAWRAEQAAQPLAETQLITGDALFPGGPGKTDSPTNFTTLMDDLERKIFAQFADTAVVHPGHGDSTLLGVERNSLPQWRARGW